MIAYQQVASEVTTRIGATFSDAQHGPELIVQYINDAIEELSESGIFRFLVFTHTFTAVSGTTTYNIPVQFSTKELYRNGALLIEGNDWVAGELAWRYPEKIAVYVDTIVLPDSTDTSEYTIQYRWSPALVNSNETSTTQINLPANFKKVLVPLACYYGWTAQKDTNAATEEYNNYLKAVPRMRAVFVNRNENSPKRVSSKHRF